MRLFDGTALGLISSYATSLYNASRFIVVKAMGVEDPARGQANDVQVSYMHTIHMMR